MGIQPRFVKCDIENCTSTCREDKFGEGFSGWGRLKGVLNKGKEEPYLCPKCLKLIMCFCDLGIQGMWNILERE